MSPPVTLDANEVVWARKRLALNRPLEEVADALGVSVADLDLTLWNRLKRFEWRAAA